MKGSTDKQINFEYYYWLMDLPCWCCCFACQVSTELWWVWLVWCDVLAKEYKGFISLVLCSSTNNRCCCSCCMYNALQQFTSFPFWHCCRSCKVCSGFLYSWLLLRMCVAYADKELLLFMYRIWSRCLVVSDCHSGQRRIFLHVLHSSL